VDLTAYGAGPRCSQFLADWGAEVIKIERPGGDAVRYSQQGAMSAMAVGTDYNYIFETHNRGKQSVVVDLTRPESRDVLHRLVAEADVFVSSMRPRELEKFGLTYDELNAVRPELIYACLTAYGRKGPDRNAPGYDWTAFWARTGMTHMHSSKAGPSLLPRPGVGDRLTGMALALGIMTALFARERTGVGQEVDASLFSTGLYALTFDVTGGLLSGADAERQDREERANPLAIDYRTKDGRYVQLCMFFPQGYWRPFCEVVGRPDLIDDPRFATDEQRTAHHAELTSILDEVFATRTFQEWRDILSGSAVIWAPIQNIAEVVRDPQIRENGLVFEFEDEQHGTIEHLGSPVVLSKSPVWMRGRAPGLGEHTDSVLAQASFSAEEIAELRRQQIIA
jgi:crotonobetainyl-CoA:carnitine CoA-transferase CaiB-like acyl-CoA transferase